MREIVIIIQKTVCDQTYLCDFTDMSQGDMVSVYADVDGSCKKGFVQNFEGASVFVGNGIAEIGRRDLFCTGESEKVR